MTDKSYKTDVYLNRYSLKAKYAIWDFGCLTCLTCLVRLARTPCSVWLGGRVSQLPGASLGSSEMQLVIYPREVRHDNTT